jgi:hypothetical protein
MQLQQFGVDSVFVFSGYSLCMWPPPHHKYVWLLAVGLDMAKVLAVVALREASLSSA